MNIPIAVSALIKESDCVIIPSIGGFISNRKSAKIIGRNNRVFPPRKEVSFNTQITQSDGLLINYIAEQEKIQFTEAKELVEELANQMMETIEAGEVVEFKGLGDLYWNNNDQIEFRPKNDTNLLSDAYGLEEFYFPTYERKSTLIQFDDQKAKTTFNISVSSNRVKQALIGLPVAALLILYPLYKSPIKLLNDSTILEANLAGSGNVTAPDIYYHTDTLAGISNYQSSEKQLNETFISEKTRAALSSPTEKVEIIDPRGSNDIVQQHKSFIVVAGCFEKNGNANRLRNDLIEKGYNSEIKVLQNGLLRVSLGKYNLKDEALEIIANPELRASYPSMWLAYEKQAR